MGYNVDNDTLEVYHSTSCVTLVEVFVHGQFIPGASGGCMLGPGFYANRFIGQAKRGSYGRYILKALVHNIKNYLIVDADAYNLVFGTKYKQSQAATFIGEQFDRIVGPEGTKTKYKEPFCPEVEVDSRPAFIGVAANPRGAAGQYSNEWLKAKQAGFHGMIYKGNWDKESIVVWNISDIEALELSCDKGKTWSHNAADILNAAKSTGADTDEIMREVEQTYKTDAEANLRDKSKCHFQRAYTLRDRVATFTPARQLKHIMSHLSRIHDADEATARKEAFKLVFPDLAIV